MNQHLVLSGGEPLDFALVTMKARGPPVYFLLINLVILCSGNDPASWASENKKSARQRCVETGPKPNVSRIAPVFFILSQSFRVPHIYTIETMAI
jgi:hypothetical protein